MASNSYVVYRTIQGSDTNWIVITRRHVNMCGKYFGHNNCHFNLGNISFVSIQKRYAHSYMFIPYVTAVYLNWFQNRWPQDTKTVMLTTVNSLRERKNHHGSFMQHFLALRSENINSRAAGRGLIVTIK